MQASELASSPRWGRNAGRKENLGSRLTDLDFLAEGSAMLEMVLEGQSVPAEKYHMLLNKVIVVDTIMKDRVFRTDIIIIIRHRGPSS